MSLFFEHIKCSTNIVINYVRMLTIMNSYKNQILYLVIESGNM